MFYLFSGPLTKGEGEASRFLLQRQKAEKCCWRENNWVEAWGILELGKESWIACDWHLSWHVLFLSTSPVPFSYSLAWYLWPSSAFPWIHIPLCSLMINHSAPCFCVMSMNSNLFTCKSSLLGRIFENSECNGETVLFFHSYIPSVHKAPLAVMGIASLSWLLCFGSFLPSYLPVRGRKR